MVRLLRVIQRWKTQNAELDNGTEVSIIIRYKFVNSVPVNRIHHVENLICQLELDSNHYEIDIFTCIHPHLYFSECCSFFRSLILRFPNSLHCLLARTSLYQEVFLDFLAEYSSFVMAAVHLFIPAVQVIVDLPPTL